MSIATKREYFVIFCSILYALLTSTTLFGALRGTLHALEKAKVTRGVSDFRSQGGVLQKNNKKTLYLPIALRYKSQFNRAMKWSFHPE